MVNAQQMNCMTIVVEKSKLFPTNEVGPGKP